MQSEKVFNITEEEHQQVLEASRPTAAIMVGGSLGASPQESANSAWRSIAQKHGVVWDSIRPYGPTARTLIGTEYVEPQKLGRAINIVLAPIAGTPDYSLVDAEYDDGRGVKVGTWRGHSTQPNLSVIRITAEDFEKAIKGEVLPE